MKFKAKYLRRAYWQKHLHLDLGDHRRAVFLAGSGRSGTTWAEDVINYRGDYRVMFEPFHPGKVSLVADWNPRQYIRPQDRSPRFLTPARRILDGAIDNRWIDRFGRPLVSRRRLIKEIRAHLFLKWIKTRFPAVRIVLLLRHPCAVAQSRLEFGWISRLESLLIQPDLMQDHLAPFASAIAAARDPFERHILMWCIENYVPLRQFRPGEIHVVYYEDLCTKPEPTVRALLQFLGRSYAPSVLDRIGRASALAGEASAVRTGADPVTRWRRHVDPSRVQRAMDILDRFDLRRIYAEAPMPRIPAGQCPVGP